MGDQTKKLCSTTPVCYPCVSGATSFFFATLLCAETAREEFFMHNIDVEMLHSSRDFSAQSEVAEHKIRRSTYTRVDTHASHVVRHAV